MNELYVLSSTRKGYLRSENYCYPLENNILIQGAYLIGENGTSFPDNSKKISHIMFEMKLVFLELTFDPISRIKRGKFYKIDNEVGQPLFIYPYQGQGGIYQISSPSSLASQNSIQAYKFLPYEMTREFNPRSTFVIFGNSRFETRWKIISIDASVTNEEVYVLQEVNSIGAIPSLKKSSIPMQYYSEIDQEYNSLLNELNSSPESVIDHCRDVLTSILTAIAKAVDKDDRADLGKLISKIDDQYKVIRSSAEIVNRLHPRRKPNEREKYNLNELTRSDSDFAVQCVFQIIREMKWHDH